MSAKPTKPTEAKEGQAANADPRQVRLVRGPTVPTIFAEGISQMVLGFPMSKLVYFQAVDQDLKSNPPAEVHQMACEVIMPTAAMAEAAITVLKHMAQNKALLDNSRAEWTARVDAVLQQLNGVSFEQPALGAKEVVQKP